MSPTTDGKCSWLVFRRVDRSAHAAIGGAVDGDWEARQGRSQRSRGERGSQGWRPGGVPGSIAALTLRSEEPWMATGEQLQGRLLESFDINLKGWQPRQRHPGTRITHYRCFLPDLAGFASYRRGGTDGATINLGAGCTRHILCLALRAASLCRSASCRSVEPDVFDFAGSNPALSCGSDRGRKKTGGCITLQNWRRERDSNPRNGLTRLHTFQACSFNRSDTSPHTVRRTSSPCPPDGPRRILAASMPHKQTPLRQGWRTPGYAPLATIQVSPANFPCRIKP